MSDPRFSEADKDFDESNLSEDAKRTLAAAQRAATKEFAPTEEDMHILSGDGIKAGYKIEVHFGPGRTDRREFKALVLLLESGKHFHGGGDSQMYVCLDHRPFEQDNTTPPSALPAMKQLAKMGPGHNLKLGCGNPLPPALVQLGVANCLTCNRLINAEHLTGQLPFYGTTQDLAEFVELLFLKLKSNADVYCKYDRTDIRYKAIEREKGFDEARRLRGLFIYPLAHILKDTANGSTLQSRFRAFLSA